MSSLINTETDNKYRYYHCIMTPFGDWACQERYKMSSPGDSITNVKAHPSNITKCLEVPSYIPKVFDPLVLKYMSIPRVKVTK